MYHLPVAIKPVSFKCITNFIENNKVCKCAMNSKLYANSKALYVYVHIQTLLSALGRATCLSGE